MKKPRYQSGQLYISRSGSIRCKYWTTTTDGPKTTRVRKDVFIAQQDDKHFARKNSDGTWVFSNAVLQIRDRLMLDINERQTAFHQKIEVKGITGTGTVYGNIRTIQGFYENVYLPWAMSELRRSTVRSYGQIWRTYLKAHFGKLTFLDYTTVMASRYLTSLAERGLTAKSISHIRAVASCIFSYALAHHGLIPNNPWDSAKSAKKYKKSKPTGFYSVEEATGIIAALGEKHPDWAALIGLCFYTGLRPSEAIAVRWEDFRITNDMWHVQIVRGCVEGDVAETKTADSKQSVPMASQLVDLLTVWHSKSGSRRSGWVFPGKGDKKPVDLRNLGQRELKPAVIDAGFPWHGLYAFRRGLATHLKDLGDVMSAQAMLRHKNPDTTEQHYARLTAADKLRAIKFLESGQTARD
ncbi:MAG TPA: tyrosine-type recombinase/integrase [Terriglobales bacterium]|nr:tyrosine-type recombinase/integrase [Terriglobales bacterium]